MTKRVVPMTKCVIAVCVTKCVIVEVIMSAYDDSDFRKRKTMLNVISR